ncbi:MAG TPA: BatA domain-containing protein [Planctomycetota bacterium]|nr:BatA domain-containing protein [Planctomycetota bacterium]
MELLHPWLLLGLLVVPAAVLLHVFRVPGRRHEVSYLGLWRSVLTRVHPEATERLKRFDWLLLLELLVLFLLVLGLSGPVVWTERPRRHVGFILDTSASMKTVETDGRSRFGHAVAAVAALLDDLSDDDVVSTFAGPSPQVTGQGDTVETFRAVLAGLKPDDVAVEPEKLLEQGLVALGDAPGAVFLVTDKAPTEVLASLEGRVRPVIVGGPSRNVGIVGFSVTPDGNGAREVFVRVRNSGDTPVERLLLIGPDEIVPILLGERGEPAGDLGRELSVPPGKAVDLVARVLLKPNAVRVHAKLGSEVDGSPVDDGFAADDAVGAVLRPLTVVAVGREVNPAYRRLFGGAVFEDTVYAEVEEAAAGVIPPDALLIAEGVIPQAFGRVTVLVNPPAGEAAGVTIGEAKRRDASSAIPVQGTDALMRKVDLTKVAFKQYRPLTLPTTARPLLTMGEGDVVAATVDRPEGKLIILSFDATASGWHLRESTAVSFVVFWANVIAEARTGAGAGGMVWYRPGEIVRLPVGERGTVETPGGGRVTVAGDAGGWTAYRPVEVGDYRWSAGAAGGDFRVNLMSGTESDNRPQSAGVHPVELPIPVRAGRSVPLGPWLCLAAGVLTVVWWYFRR